MLTGDLDAELGLVGSGAWPSGAWPKKQRTFTGNSGVVAPTHTYTSSSGQSQIDLNTFMQVQAAY